MVFKRGARRPTGFRAPSQSYLCMSKGSSGVMDVAPLKNHEIITPSYLWREKKVFRDSVFASAKTPHFIYV